MSPTKAIDSCAGFTFSVEVDDVEASPDSPTLAGETPLVGSLEQAANAAVKQITNPKILIDLIPISPLNSAVLTTDRCPTKQPLDTPNPCTAKHKMRGVLAEKEQSVYPPTHHHQHRETS